MIAVIACLPGHLEHQQFHPGGINVVLADGSVHFLLDDIDHFMYQAHATIGGDTNLEDRLRALLTLGW